MNIKKLQKLVFKTALNNGHVENWNNHNTVGDIAELGLICSEVSEAQEIIRNDTDFNSLAFECADIIIRTLCFLERKGIFNIEKFILTKNNINKERGYLHGKTV